MLAAAERYPAMDLQSDGLWDDAEWVAARELFEDALGREPKVPAGMVKEYRDYRGPRGAGMQAWVKGSGKVEAVIGFDWNAPKRFGDVPGFERWAADEGWEPVAD